MVLGRHLMESSVKSLLYLNESAGSYQYSVWIFCLTCVCVFTYATGCCALSSWTCSSGYECRLNTWTVKCDMPSVCVSVVRVACPPHASCVPLSFSPGVTFLPCLRAVQACLKWLLARNQSLPSSPSQPCALLEYSPTAFCEPPGIKIIKIRMDLHVQ